MGVCFEVSGGLHLSYKGEGGCEQHSRLLPQELQELPLLLGPGCRTHGKTKGLTVTVLCGPEEGCFVR